MPAYYAMGYLSEILFRVTTIGEHPHAKTPNAGPQAPPIAGAKNERRLLAVACRPWLGRLRHGNVLVRDILQALSSSTLEACLKARYSAILLVIEIGEIPGALIFLIHTVRTMLTFRT